MVKTGIKIYARLRPTRKSTKVYDIEEREDGLGALSFTIPRSENSGAVNNRQETYTFRFTRVFDCKASQEEIFNEVSRGVINNCLEGYNGTIFAYGQTGSGKTFTITGGVERYSDRGLIPRTLSYLFQQYEKSPNTMFSTHISYLEIYNECGYDLLDHRHDTARLEDLPKVTLLEDSESVIHLRNLSLHPASNEEEALNWLFLGDTNRMMAETPMNMASTRSHCIFTIHISAREPGSDTVRRAKLHLVDLAGSERVGKTGMEGILLTEAKYINLSLHYLEQVIVALSDKSRSHIPYRNSMMTSVLRDSLGGNCMTSMIATCSVEKRNIDETISTCRFSQRVALVKNEATLNEELDPKLMVQHLKQQVAELRDELSLATGGEEREGELDTTEKERCGQLVEAYVQDTSPEARLLVGGDMRKIQLCFALLKAKLQTSTLSPPPPPPPPTTTTTTTHSSEPTSDPESTVPQLRRLEEIIHQRDEEISILLKMLKQEQQKVAKLEMALKGGSVRERGEGSKEGGRGEEGEEEKEGRGDCDSASQGTSEEGLQIQKEVSRKTWKTELSRARQEAFDSFRKGCPIMARVTQHKTALKTRYSQAKALGEEVNTARNTINQLKAHLEKCRISRGLAGLTRGMASDTGLDERETEIKTEIEAEKTRFKSLYQTLRGMKTEIEHMQHLLEKSKVEVQQEFEVWWQSQVGKTTRAAWRTPPTSTSSPQSHQHTYHSAGHDTTTTNSSGQTVNVPLAYRTPVTPQPLFPAHVVSPLTPHTISSLAPLVPIPSAMSGHPTISPPAPRTPRPPTISPPAPRTPRPPPAPHPPTVPLTGDARADADILAFYKARQRLISRGHHNF